MRKRTKKIVITFENTHTAIKMEKYCKENNLPGRIIPLPGEISSGCGLCWCILPEEKELLCRHIHNGQLPYENMVEVLL